MASNELQHLGLKTVDDPKKIIELLSRASTIAVSVSEAFKTSGYPEAAQKAIDTLAINLGLAIKHLKVAVPPSDPISFTGWRAINAKKGSEIKNNLARVPGLVKEALTGAESLTEVQRVDFEDVTGALQVMPGIRVKYRGAGISYQLSPDAPEATRKAMYTFDLQYEMDRLRSALKGGDYHRGSDGVYRETRGNIDLLNSTKTVSEKLTFNYQAALALSASGRGR